MKLTMILLVTAGLLVSAGCFSQDLDFSWKNVPLKKVLSDIEKRSGYVFFYDYAIFAQDRPVTLRIKKASLRELLDSLLKGQGLNYKIAERTIFLTRNPATRPVLSAPPATSFKGRVMNEKGEPLEGATVLVKDGTKVVRTNADGSFELKMAVPEVMVEISYTGFMTRQIRMSGGPLLPIVLAIHVNPLDETVVIAYGTTTGRLNTGDLAIVTSKDIGQQPVSNPLAALEGRATGILVTQANGFPGSAFKIQVRGQSSIGTAPGILPPDNPLFIIDGVPFAPDNNSLQIITTSALGLQGRSPFNSLNPGDIEKIEILKDADATAIYGSRGANGVILITTRTGKPGKIKFDAQAWSGVSKALSNTRLLNTKQYVAMREETLHNDGLPLDETNAPDLVLWDTTRYTDFKKLLTGHTAHQTDIYASASGGNANTTFILSGGFHYEGTVMPGNFADKKENVHFNFNHSSDDHKFKMTLSVLYSSDHNNLLTQDITINTFLNPNAPRLYDPSGRINYIENGLLFANPLFQLNRKYSATTDNLIGNLRLSYQLGSNFSILSSFGYNSLQSSEVSIKPLSSQIYGTTASSEFGTNNFRGWIIEPQIEYHSSPGKGKLSLLLGATFQSQDNDASDISARGFPSDAFIYSISAASTVTASNYNPRYRYAAVFGRVNYNLSDKYILNLSGRRDGSSRFGPGRQFGNFGAAGGAWVFSNEETVKEKLGFLSYGKLRGSYGITGSDQIGDYLFLDTWTSTDNQGVYQGISGLRPTRLYNPDFNWELTKKIEGALELGLNKDRLLFTAVFYRHRTGNQLVAYKLPAQTGFSSLATKNFPAVVQNTGWEISLLSKNIVSDKFNWTTTFTITLPRNKLLAFPGLESSSYAGTLTIGRSLTSKRTLHYLGVDPATGLFRAEDVDHDGLIGYPGDYRPSGNYDPTYYGGLRNTFTYKGLELDLFFDYRKQKAQNPLVLIYNNNPPGVYVGNSNQPVSVLDRWQKPGDKAVLQQYSSNPGSAAYNALSNFTSSDAIFADGAFIRLRTASLCYNFQKKALKKFHAEKLRIFLQGQNLLTITAYKGADPETQNPLSLAPLRTFAAGIQIIPQ